MLTNIKKSFTLIELLIVVAIIGILAGVGIPMYNGYMDDAKKRVTEANHNVIYEYIVNETTKCEINSSAELMNLNGENLLKCSDFFGPNVNWGNVSGKMKLYFDGHIENAYKADKTAIHTGRYQGTCVPSGTNPENWGGLNEQGTHHLVVGWWKNLNKLTLYLDTCIESSGKALSKAYNIRGKD
jgi:prepilin-type N-terminal cleavage/methylation domain-containing protein